VHARHVIAGAGREHEIGTQTIQVTNWPATQPLAAAWPTDLLTQLQEFGPPGPPSALVQQLAHIRVRQRQHQHVVRRQRLGACSEQDISAYSAQPASLRWRRKATAALATGTLANTRYTNHCSIQHQPPVAVRAMSLQLPAHAHMPLLMHSM
jgi:hypothetical protein